jgi:uncharacterized membrane protein YuzA (DUF378 family)
MLVSGLVWGLVGIPFRRLVGGLVGVIVGRLVVCVFVVGLVGVLSSNLDKKPTKLYKQSDAIT